jgi:hypothetical protein
MHSFGMVNCFMPIHPASGPGGSGSKTSEMQDVEVLDQLTWDRPMTGVCGVEMWNAGGSEFAGRPQK